MSHPRKIWACLFVLTVGLFSAGFSAPWLGAEPVAGRVARGDDSNRNGSFSSVPSRRTAVEPIDAGDIRAGLSCPENLRNRGRYSPGAGGETFADCRSSLNVLRTVVVLGPGEAVCALCRLPCNEANPTSPRSPPVLS